MSLLSKVRAKHPALQIDAADNDTMIMVDTDVERIWYVLNAANRLHVSRKRSLTATEISVKKQPINCVIMLQDGTYYNGIDNRFVTTTVDINAAHKMCNYVANEVVNTLRTHAMACYGNVFQIITL